MPIDWGPIWLTLRLAGITTFILLFIGVPLASWLALSRFRLKPLIETFISLPLVLPPSVVGFYLRTLWYVLLPNCTPALLTGVVLSFAHTIGEFGLVLMIGGNLPGQTRVASIAIYDEVELLNFDTAHTYAVLLLGISFLILLLVYGINKRVTI